MTNKMPSFRDLLVAALTFSSFFIFNEPIKSQEKIIVTPLIESTKGLSGKKISYPRGKQAELRLLKVNIPVGLSTPIHIHPAPMLVYVSQGKLKHVRGEKVNFFSEGDSFVESNKGSQHYVKSIGEKPAILFVGVSSVEGMPTTINK